MSYQAYAILKIVSDGSPNIPFSFDYLSEDEIIVEINGVATSDWSLSSANIVTLDEAPSLGAFVTIRRSTDLGNPAVDFNSSSVLTAADLDLSTKQVFNAAQEVKDISQQVIKEGQDENYTASNKILKDLQDPVDPQDAATKAFTEATRSEILAATTDVLAAQSDVTIKSSDVTQIRNELYGLTTQLISLPYGQTGSVSYDASTGLLTFSLSEGPQGPVGPHGPAGSTGPQGPVGQEGPIGPQGPIGPTGDTGSIGPQGIQGVAGLQGPRGETGDVGPQGIQGVTGDQGSQGPAGATGPQGPVGSQGPIGPTGSEGPIGATGATGSQGPQGIQGNLGDKGPTGDQGPVGPTGPTGSQGPMGTSPLGLSFGRFVLNVSTGVLSVEYYGDADDQDFSINSNGELEVEI